MLAEPLIALLERGQAAGEFSRELPPPWMARAFGALLLAGARDGANPDTVSAPSSEGCAREHPHVSATDCCPNGAARRA